MTRPIALVLIACAYVLVSCAQVYGASWDIVVFRDDFDASVGGMPNPDDWVVNHPGAWWWVQGRTHFPNPDPWLADGKFPRVENGVCSIKHHLYNPYDLGTPRTTFLGGEIHTVQEFEPNRAYRFEARVKLLSSPPYPDGLVTSFFLYGYDGSKSDEIDFEFLSKKMNNNAQYPNGDPVLTNPWNESVENPEYVVPEGLDLTQWNTFRIYWDPNLSRIDWTWVDPIQGEVLLRTETGGSVPDETMALYFNFWAPSATWGDAYDADLQPLDNENGNEIYEYQIDYVEVRTTATVPALSWRGAIVFLVLLAGSSLWLVRRRS